MMGLVHSDQGVLFGDPDVVGYSRGDLCVREIPKEVADEVIREGHYSGSVVWSSNLHMGAFLGGRLIGAIQFGPAMNPASGASVVEGTEPDQWTELNRLWLTDDKPENCTSRVIAYALRALRVIRPRVAWVQTFADERCGKLGAIYQACSFVYCGHHATTFYELDGEWYHQSMKGRPEYDSRGWWCGPKIARFRRHERRAVPHTFRQFRYLRFLRPWARRALLLEPQPYPKPSEFGPIRRRRVGAPRGGARA